MATQAQGGVTVKHVAQRTSRNKGSYMSIGRPTTARGRGRQRPQQAPTSSPLLQHRAGGAHPRAPQGTKTVRKQATREAGELLQEGTRKASKGNSNLATETGEAEGALVGFHQGLSGKASAGCAGDAAEPRVPSLGREDPPEKEMAMHSRTLAWKIPWTEESKGLQSMGSQKSQT